MDTRTFTADELKKYSDAIAAGVREACAKLMDGMADGRADAIRIERGRGYVDT